MSLRSDYVKGILAARRAQTRLDAEAAQGLEALLARTAQRLRTEIRTTPRGILGERYRRELLAKLEATLESFRAEYKDQLDMGIVGMARIAAERERSLLDAVLAQRDREAGILPGAEATLGQAQRLARLGTAVTRFGEVPQIALQRAYQRTYKDGLVLSQRLYNLDRDARKELADTLVEGIARGESARNLARRIAPVLEANGAENVAYKARRIARTEINTAFREGHLASITDSTGQLQPWVSAIGWRLSPAHPRIDICDWWAADSSDGVGAGNYLPQNLPIGHPNCKCYTVTILSVLPQEQFVSRVAYPDQVPQSQLRYYGANRSEGDTQE